MLLLTGALFTVIGAAFPKEKRAQARGVWGGVAGLAVALGPVVGGAIVDAISWQWIFWANVPPGIALVPLVLRNVGTGMFGLVWGVVRSRQLGRLDGEVVFALVAGAGAVVLFLLWEWSSDEPMLPLDLFRNRTFATAKARRSSWTSASSASSS